jgi:hypothetical protein
VISLLINLQLEKSKDDIDDIDDIATLGFDN